MGVANGLKGSGVPQPHCVVRHILRPLSPGCEQMPVGAERGDEDLPVARSWLADWPAGLDVPEAKR